MSEIFENPVPLSTDTTSPDALTGAGSRASACRSRRKVTKNADLKLKVALLMFAEPYPASREIADQLSREHPGLDFRAVIALFREAIKEELVKGLIMRPFPEQERVRMELELVRRYPCLRYVKLVPGSPDIARDLEPEARQRLHRDTIFDLFPAAADLIDDFLVQRDRMHRGIAKRTGTMPVTTVGVTWGKTLYLLAKFLGSTRRPPLRTPIEFLPVIGQSLHPHEVGLEADHIAMSLAETFGGKARQLPCEAFPRNAEAIALRRSEAVAAMLAKVRDVDLVVSSVGGVGVGGVEDLKLSLDPRVNAELIDSDPHRRASGRLGLWFWDRNGNELRLKTRQAIGIGLDGLRRVAANENKMSLIVTGGDRLRFDSIRGALAGGLASHLVTDTVTGEALLA